MLVFVDPRVKASMNESQYDDYDCRNYGVLVWEMIATYCGTDIQSRWLMQKLEWADGPSEITPDDDRRRRSHKAAGLGGCFRQTSGCLQISTNRAKKIF
jgi:hypothetical protein